MQGGGKVAVVARVKRETTSNFTPVGVLFSSRTLETCTQDAPEEGGRNKFAKHEDDAMNSKLPSSSNYITFMFQKNMVNIMDPLFGQTYTADLNALLNRGYDGIFPGSIFEIHGIPRFRPDASHFVAMMSTLLEVSPPVPVDIVTKMNKMRDDFFPDAAPAAAAETPPTSPQAAVVSPQNGFECPVCFEDKEEDDATVAVCDSCHYAWCKDCNAKIAIAEEPSVRFKCPNCALCLLCYSDARCRCVEVSLTL